VRSGEDEAAFKMNRTAYPLSTATPAELEFLHGKLVLVYSSHDRRNPPAGLRGTIEVRPHGPRPVVEIKLEFPQMFTTTAQIRTLVLDDAGLERLLESERNGTFEYTIDEPLDPRPRLINR
jgi:hypothetical protein